MLVLIALGSYFVAEINLLQSITPTVYDQLLPIPLNTNQVLKKHITYRKMLVKLAPCLDDVLLSHLKVPIHHVLATFGLVNHSKMLASLLSGVNFINILPAWFFVRKRIEQLFSTYTWLCNFLHQNIGTNS